MASLKRDVQTIVDRLCGEHGCTARLTNTGHWRVTRPGYGAITIARTPSDRRAMANIKGDCKRHLGAAV